MKSLGRQLVEPAIKTRANPPRLGLPTSVTKAIEATIGKLPQPPGQAKYTISVKRNRCGDCPRSYDTKYAVICS